MLDDRHPVSLRRGQTCFFMVFHTMLRRILNFCFCAISSREFFVCAIFYPFYPNYEKDVLIIFIYMYHKYFQTGLSSVISQVGQLPNGIPHLTINISFHCRFPFPLFFSPIWLTWPNSPTWKTWPTKLTSCNNQDSLSPSFAFFSLGEKLSPIYPRRRT